MAAPARSPSLVPSPSPALRLGFALLAGGAALALGTAAGMGTSRALLIAGVVGPFVILLTLARPHWAVTLYTVIVYADILSVLTKFYDLPQLARFAGVLLLSAVLGYRLLIQRGKLVGDEMTWWMIGYAAVVALGLIYARDRDLVQLNLIDFSRSLITYLVVINIITSRARLRIVLWALVGMATVLAGLTIFQAATGQYDNNFGGFAVYRISGISGDDEAPRPGGTFGDANYYGQALLVLLPVALYFALERKRQIERLAGATCSAILIAAVVFTYSRGDALALGGILVAALILKRPSPAVLLAGGVALIVLLPLLPANYVSRLTTIVSAFQGDTDTIYNEYSIRGRAGAIQAAIAMFLDHPITGVGRENYPLYQLQYLEGSSLAYKSQGIPPHDLYLEIAAEHGLIGLAFFAGFFLGLGRALWEARRRFLAVADADGAALAAWLAIMVGGWLMSSLFLHGAYLYMLWLQVALVIALRQLARTPNSAPAGYTLEEGRES